MAARMIRVRSKVTGEEALVSERAFKHFAGYYERLDGAGQPDPAPQPSAAPAQPSPPAPPKSSPVRRPAASTDKE